MDEVRRFVTGVACKSVGGSWKGGHDISGHVFLLVLGSMFLFEEVLHVVLKPQITKEERTVSMADGAVKSAEVEATLGGYDNTVERPGQWTVGARVGLGVGVLSVYMLLMTAAYFHTWFEKVRQTLFTVLGTLLTLDTAYWAFRRTLWNICGVFPSKSGTGTERCRWDARGLEALDNCTKRGRNFNE